MKNIQKPSFMVNQVVKILNRYNETSCSEETQPKSLTNTTIEPSCEEDNQRRIVIHKKEKKFKQRIFKLHPELRSHHIFRLFGFVGINQKSIEDPNHSQSYLFSHFDDRIVEKLEFYQHAIVIQMTEPQISFFQPTVEYLIQRFKARGDTNFSEIAQLVSEVVQLFKILQSGKPPQARVDSVKKWLDYLGDAMYVVFLGPRKFAISKSLLTYLQYDVDEVSIEIIKSRSLFLEFFSAMSYSQGLKGILNTLKFTALLNMGRIAPQQFMEKTKIYMHQYLQSKNHVRTFCKMSLGFLNATYVIHKVEEIYYQTDLKGKMIHKSNLIQMAIQDEKDKVRQEQYTTVKKIKNIPKAWLKENEMKTAGYKEILQKSQSQLQNLKIE